MAVNSTITSARHIKFTLNNAKTSWPSSTMDLCTLDFVDPGQRQAADIQKRVHNLVAIFPESTALNSI